uniref:Uncharacterized protein n=1 Tax=Rhizophora mucronata TaxID=61149 RepID=A0A2P2PAJ4_RHIMU
MTWFLWPTLGSVQVAESQQIQNSYWPLQFILHISVA